MPYINGRVVITKSEIRIFSVPRGFMAEGAPDYDIPTFSGWDARRALVRAWGLPNAWPRVGESIFTHCREMFVDDFDGGRPKAYWVPNPIERAERRYQYTEERRLA